MSMVMSDQERIRHIQESATKFRARNTCVDPSLLTMVAQAKSSRIANPTTVSAVVNQGGCGTNATIVGNGAGGEYFAILQASQGSAICACSDPIDTFANPVITLPTVCLDMSAPPFTQQNLSNFYTPPCVDPGKRDYFPQKIYDGPGCTYNRITTPS